MLVILLLWRRYGVTHPSSSLGGAAMAHTILGIDFNPEMGTLKYDCGNFVVLCLPCQQDR
jgi:hypothetical protein